VTVKSSNYYIRNKVTHYKYEKLRNVQHGQQALRLEQTDHKNPHSLASSPQIPRRDSHKRGLTLRKPPPNWFRAQTDVSLQQWFHYKWKQLSTIITNVKVPVHVKVSTSALSTAENFLRNENLGMFSEVLP
jgi:hypothetical protein